MIERENYYKIKLILLSLYEYTCQICFDIFNYDELEIDHKIAIGLGGSDEIVNLQLVCRYCHKNKTKLDLKKIKKKRLLSQV